VVNDEIVITAEEAKELMKHSEKSSKNESP
jgi:hypothetical protein